MEVHREACRAFWREYLAELPPDHAHRFVEPDAFGFGAEIGIADDLAELVLSGSKRATTSLPIEYTSLGEPLPKVGDLSIVVRGDGRPVALIERTQVTTVPFETVRQEYAAIEGEGDGSLDDWRAGHADYFRHVCNRLGGQFDAGTSVLCQVFRVIRTTRDAG